jgi:hypothetical protein
MSTPSRPGGRHDKASGQDDFDNWRQGGTNPPVACTVCNYAPTPTRPAGSNDVWECSHIHCPNRHPITAAPSDQPPKSEL